jgi:hypothetical protein
MATRQEQTLDGLEQFGVVDSEVEKTYAVIIRQEYNL